MFSGTTRQKQIPSTYMQVDVVRNFSEGCHMTIWGMAMDLRSALQTIALVCCLGPVGDLKATSVNHPNVIVILADDQGYGDLASHGNQFVRTPRLDRFATESARLDHFYATPVCATTRASLLTGRSFPQTGVWGVHLARDYMRLDETTLAEVFRGAGYSTGFMGKWHNGKHEPWLPWNRGFQECWMAELYIHENAAVSHNGHFQQWRGWTSDRLADQAIQFIDQNKKQPFFLYLAYLAPHEPWHAPADLVKSYQERGLSPSLSTVFAMIEQMDTSVGRVLDAVDRHGLTEETIIVYFSDNGPIDASSNMENLNEAEMAMRNPAGLRGRKGNPWDNSVRVPCFIRWPGKVRPTSIQDVTHVRDLFPTLVDLSNIRSQSPPKHALDGISLGPLLSGKVPSLAPREIVMPYWEPRWPQYDTGVLDRSSELEFGVQTVSVRSQDMKWVQTAGVQQLFDMDADPQEQHDLSVRKPEDTFNFSLLAKSWFSNLQQDGRAYQQPRFPIGINTRLIDEVAETRNIGHLPGFSAVRTSGNVRVTTHWSENWDAVGDSQTLLVEVRDSGRYRVEIEADDSSPDAAVAIDVQGRSLTGKLTDSSLSILGELFLEKGQSEITVRSVTPAPKTGGFMKKFWGIRFTYLGKN